MFSRANCLIACWCEGDFATGMQGLAFPVVVGARERLPPNCEHCARPRVRTAPGREKQRPVRAVVGFDRKLARSRGPGVYPGAGKLAMLAAGSTLFPNISTPECSW